MATVYKIKRKSDGLFSTGGVSPNFTKKGKTWNHLGYLRTHLNLVQQYKYKDCVVITIEVVEHQVGTGLEVSYYFEEATKKRAEAEQKRKQKEHQTTKEYRRQTYLQLQKEFD